MEDKEQIIDITKIKNTFRDIQPQLKRYAVPLLILIPILLSIFFRMQPFYLPIADDWAETTVMEGMKSQIAAEIDKQYANLPDENKQTIINENLNAMINSNRPEFDANVNGMAEYIRSKMQDDSGQTYLLAIDPYLWYGNSKNYIENGQFGDEMRDGVDWYSLRNGRVGRPASIPFNSMITVLVYNVMSIFDDDVNIMTAAFLVPLIIMTLAVIPVFFIGRKFAGNIGGFFAATLFAIHPALLNRTVAGFSDTDPYTVFFPVLAIWLFFEALDAKDNKKKYALFSLTALSLAFFNLAWAQGWWYTFDFIMATMGLSLVYYIINNFNSIKDSFGSFVKGNEVKQFFITVIFLSVGVAVFRGIMALFIQGESIMKGVTEVYSAFIIQPLWFLQLKAVAVTTIWPNVLTTVAELNPSNWNNIVSQMGGMLLFSIGIIGLIFILMEARKSDKQYFKFAVFMAIWLLASIYAALSSLRFIALIVPVFSLAFGAGIGIGYKYIQKWSVKNMGINKYMLSTVLMLLFLVLFIQPANSAWGTVNSELPSFTDAWHESLLDIKENSDDAIITSWWDFGHWFVAMGERRVTFDGGDQGNRIHWVGKSLLTDNEEEAVGILRMLNCGQEYAYETLVNYTDDDYASKMLLDEMILLDRDGASELMDIAGLTNKEQEQVLELTHCEDLIDQYYITSGDMLSKAGVWAHFGGWDFERAKMFSTVKPMNSVKGTQVLEEDFGLSPKEADKIYYEIKSQSGDQWITGWPGYVTALSPCSLREDMLVCSNGLVLNITTMDAYVSLQEGPAKPHSIVYAGENDIEELVFDGKTIGFSAAIINNGGGYQSILMDKSLATSMFTRLYLFDGFGLKHFKKFSEKTTYNGLKILTWTVDWDGVEDVLVDEDLEIDVSEVDNLSQ